VRAVPRLCEFYPGICLTTEEKARKNLSQGKKNLSQVKKNLSQSTVYILPKSPTHYKTLTNTHITWRLLAWSGWSCSYILNTLADANKISMTNTYCVYTVLRYSWWWTVDLYKTCRVLYQINLRIVHLLGFHYMNRWVYNLLNSNHSLLQKK